MSWRSKDWHYVSAAETAKPGYLERRFAEIRARQAAEAEAQRQQEKAEAEVTWIHRPKST